MKSNSIETFLVGKSEYIFNIILQISSRRYAFILLPFIATAISLFSAYPSYDIVDDQEMSSNWNAILHQTTDPFNPEEYNGSSHQANLAFRLTPVFLARVFLIENIYGYLILQFVCLVFLFIVISRLFKKIIDDPVVYYLLTLSISLTFIGNVLCSDYRGFFDVVAFLCLSTSMFFKNSKLIFLVLLLAYFADERALIASGLIYVYFVFERSQDVKSINFRSFILFQNKLIALVLSWLSYVIIRVTLSDLFGLKTNDEVLVDYLFTKTIHQINMLPFGLWTGLEGFWIILLLSIIVLIQNRKWFALCLYLLALVVVIFVAIWVFDITRSMAYLLPSIFLSLILLSKSQNPLMLRYISLVVLVLCIFPTYYAGGAKEISWLYPFPFQLIRMLL